ncbi:hypothetical protein JB92DRAFT_3120944 [Gautieria morchelliformis]|nr:hypothetical protein JB92DRAFT_3120944 [Gautieria morchelliformis]
MCLTEFTFESATKYKTGSPGKDLSPLYSVHNALLRRFTYDNPTLIDWVEGEHDDDDNFREKEARKRKKTAVAHVKKGEDYWSCVDSWFTGPITAWGADIGIGNWKEYIDETLQRDADRFPQVTANYAINFAVPEVSWRGAPLQATTNTVAVPPAIQRGGLDAILNMS